MAKPLIDELREEMENLKKSEAEKIYEAIENREFPPIPMTIPTVQKAVNKVLSEHEVTPDELAMAIGQREMTPDELKLIHELSKEEN